jgi:hypothetical protein
MEFLEILIIIVLIVFVLILGYLWLINRHESVNEKNTSNYSVNANINNTKKCPSGAVCGEKNYPEAGDKDFPVLANTPDDERGYSGDCYLFPGICPKETYCQLDDRIRWARNEQATRGRCVRYQKECYSCTPTAEDYLIDKSKFPAFNSQTLTPDGVFTERTVACSPDLICTGSTIPDLPSTCVQRRPRDRRNPPTRDELIQWSLRFVRLGGRSSKGIGSLPCSNHQNGICVRYDTNVVKRSPYTRGSNQEDLIKTTNSLLEVLWPPKFGKFPGPFTPGVDDSDMLNCEDPKYLQTLTDYQRESGGCDYRAPVQDIEINEKLNLKNAPPCLYQGDFAYNDEAPSIWCLLHTITANLPEVLSLEQKEALETIPSFLQQYLSCGTCRGNIRNHLFRVSMPKSYFRNDWFKFFWQVHNYVNNQTAHTRCGTNTSCGLPWAIESDTCAGKYKFPWFLPFSDALKQWTI